jgi:hypothetical protein
MELRRYEEWRPSPVLLAGQASHRTRLGQTERPGDEEAHAAVLVAEGAMSSVNGTISLREAQAPLGPGEARFTLELGVLIRGEVRRGAARHGVDWFEQKNWLDSFFVFRGPADRMLRFHAAVKEFERQLEVEA